MLGIDVVDIERLRASLERSPRLEQRLFTDLEVAYCRATADPVISFAGTLAAKEAVIKALRLGPLVAWALRVEISRADSGAPSASVELGTVSPAIEVSIAHDAGVAVAAAFAWPA